MDTCGSALTASWTQLLHGGWLPCANGISFRDEIATNRPEALNHNGVLQIGCRRYHSDHVQWFVCFEIFPFFEDNDRNCRLGCEDGPRFADFFIRLRHEVFLRDLIHTFCLGVRDGVVVLGIVKAHGCAHKHHRRNAESGPF